MPISDSPNGTPVSWKLRDLPYGVRFAIGLVAIVLLGGLYVSGQFMISHYENRDGVDGLSLDDLRGAYHGVNKPAPMITILENGHSDPAADADLTGDEKQALLEWLRGDDISMNFDNFDLGDMAPIEIMDRRCMQCHAADATEGDEIGQDVRLEYWSDVEKVVYSKDISPTDPEIVMLSMHTHAVGIGTLVGLSILLLALTSWPRSLVQSLALVSALGLLIDLGSWFPARADDRFVYLIVIGGFMFGVGTALSLVAVLIDAWLPGRARRG